MQRAARAPRGRGRGPTAAGRPAGGRGDPGGAARRGWGVLGPAGAARGHLKSAFGRTHAAPPPIPISSFRGHLSVPVPCPEVSKLLCSRGHLPPGDPAAPATGEGGGLGIFFRGCSRLGDRSFGVRGCFAAPREKGTKVPFVCSLAPQRRQLEGPQRGSGTAAADRPPLPAAAATRARGFWACGRARSGGGWQERGRGLGRGHFRSRGPSPGAAARGVCRWARSAGPRGLRGAARRLRGAPGDRRVPGTPLPPSEASEAPPGLLPPCTNSP